MASSRPAVMTNRSVALFRALDELLALPHLGAADVFRTGPERDAVRAGKDFQRPGRILVEGEERVAAEVADLVNLAAKVERLRSGLRRLTLGKDRPVANRRAALQGLHHSGEREAGDLRDDGGRVEHGICDRFPLILRVGLEHHGRDASAYRRWIERQRDRDRHGESRAVRSQSENRSGSRKAGRQRRRARRALRDRDLNVGGERAGRDFDLRAVGPEHGPAGGSDAGRRRRGRARGRLIATTPAAARGQSK